MITAKQMIERRDGSPDIRKVLDSMVYCEFFHGSLSKETCKARKLALNKWDRPQYPECAKCDKGDE